MIENKRLILGSLLVIVVFLSSMVFLRQFSGRLETIGNSIQETGTDIIGDGNDQKVENPDFKDRELMPGESYEIKETEDGVKYIIDPEDIIGGGPGKDGIPSIDDPNFISVEDADDWIGDDELVMAIEYKGVKRVYPLQVMVWHEIVNDEIAGDPVLITYCPLCGSAIAYERMIDGDEVEFGTSGKLYNSNLVMYDRKTDTYWTQIDGLAIIGEMTGYELQGIPIQTVLWKDYKQNHPDAEVLSKDTGENRLYGVDPYGNYYDTTRIMFPVENSDNGEIAHPKVVIYGIEVDGVFKAYREDALRKQRLVEEEVNGVSIRVEMDETGFVTITNLDSSEKMHWERDFWFAWFAFHPDTLIWEGS